MDGKVVEPNRLRELRKESRKTLEEVASWLGMTVSYVARHERGESHLSGVMIERYCLLYDVKPRDLFVAPAEELVAAI